MSIKRWQDFHGDQFVEVVLASDYDALRENSDGLRIAVDKLSQAMGNPALDFSECSIAEALVAEAIRRLPDQPPTPHPTVCAWQEDEDGVLRTDCGHAFCLDGGWSSEFRFCVYCGKSAAFCSYSPPPDEDDTDRTADQLESRLVSAARALYMAGRWTCADLSNKQEAALWEALRDSAGIKPGTATAAGVDGAAVQPPAARDRCGLHDETCETPDMCELRGCMREDPPLIGGSVQTTERRCEHGMLGYQWFPACKAQLP